VKEYPPQALTESCRVDGVRPRNPTSSAVRADDDTPFSAGPGLELGEDHVKSGNDRDESYPKDKNRRERPSVCLIPFPFGQPKMTMKAHFPSID
jgi:hypothetical protein